VIFFNNVGYLGMCVHGTVGVAVTLAHTGALAAGTHRLETPVGVVAVTLEGRNEVTVRNVPSYRLAAAVAVTVPGHGEVRGDVAWGGNWFFLLEEPALDLRLANLDRLLDFTWRVRQALAAQGVTGAGGAEVDHIELFGPPQAPGADSKNFVLCPGRAYDRSPCGTGTSAKIACLVAAGKLRPGQRWRQEGITGSVFEGSATLDGDRVVPSIKGSAFVTAEATLLFQDDDPLRAGIRG
jgi:4-hydroxyproline epimerase